MFAVVGWGGVWMGRGGRGGGWFVCGVAEGGGGGGVGGLIYIQTKGNIGGLVREG